jgi:N-methylhydantoinase B
MNNVTFGTPAWTYYETLGGGQGGSPEGPGPSAVHVAMSNTLNTPIEALERDFPLRIERYGLRRRSGGAGRERGGDGVVRAYRVLADCRLGLMTERRRHGPPGAAGGAAGAPGRNMLNGRVLPAKCSLDLRAGDLLEVRTPGGGGWGAAP